MNWKTCLPDTLYELSFGSKNEHLVQINRNEFPTYTTYSPSLVLKTMAVGYITIHLDDGSMDASLEEVEDLKRFLEKNIKQFEKLASQISKKINKLAQTTWDD